MLQTIYAGELIFFTALALIKWSILVMYYRLFPTRFMKWGYMVLGAIMGLWWIAVMLVTIFQCTPVHRFWDLATPGTCECECLLHQHQRCAEHRHGRHDPRFANIRGLQTTRATENKDCHWRQFLGRRCRDHSQHHQTEGYGGSLLLGPDC